MTLEARTANGAADADQNGKLAAQVSVLSASLANAHGQIKRLVARGFKASVEGEAEMLRARLEEALEAAKADRVAAEGLRVELREMTRTAHFHATNASQLNIEREDLAIRLKEAHNLIDGLADQRDALLASTSWRFTAPLRAVGAVVRRRSVSR